MSCFTIRANTWRSLSFSSSRIASSYGLYCGVRAGKIAEALDPQVLGQIDQDRDDDIELPFAAWRRLDRSTASASSIGRRAVDENGRVELGRLSQRRESMRLCHEFGRIRFRRGESSTTRARLRCRRSSPILFRSRVVRETRFANTWPFLAQHRRRTESVSSIRRPFGSRERRPLRLRWVVKFSRRRKR